MEKTSITVARGDGIGPEIMDACLNILDRAGANLAYEQVEVGENVYLSGNTSGIGSGFWESIRRTRVFYKAPLTTPQGAGFKSVNVTTRKTLGLYANVRPCTSFHPFVKTKHPKMDVVIVRENEEDLYAGIEHRQTDEVYQCLKLISRPGSEKICRYAFEYARAHGRKKVTCFTKDNIMKMTDGLFHKVFDEVAAEYPEIEHEHWIVDIGSANIGEHAAMFEAIHGSAPRRAGQNLANPSGLLMGGVLMLIHLGKREVAERVHNAWLRTIEDGVHTYDIFREGVSRQKVGTREFGEAVVARLGERPRQLAAVSYPPGPAVPTLGARPRPPAKRELRGVDVFLHWTASNRDPNVLGPAVQAAQGDGLRLAMVSNRGQKVWPQGAAETFCTDHWRCRFQVDDGKPAIAQTQVFELLRRIDALGLSVIKTEHLYTFDGERGYTLGQGQ